MSGGGSGGSGTQKYEWNDGTSPYWTQVLGMGNYLSGLGLPDENGNPTPGRQQQVYGGQRIAELNNDQYTALQRIRNLGDAGGSMDANQGRLQSYMTTRGDYLGRNPYAGESNEFAGAVNPWQNADPNVQWNPMLAEPRNQDYSGLKDKQNPFGSQTTNAGGQFQPDKVDSGGRFNFSPLEDGGQFSFSPLSGGGQYQPQAIDSGGRFNFDPVSGGSNKYAGDNPYFRNTLKTGLEDITSAYENGTAANTRRMFNLSGAFGGGAHQKAVANNEAALGKTLGNFTSGMLNDQYGRSAGLEESALGRGMGAQQFNVGMGNTAFENAAGRNIGVNQFGQQLGNQAFENAQGRGLQAGQFNASLGNQAFESSRGRGLQAGQFNASLGNQAFSDAAGRGMQAGQINNQFGSQSFENAANRGLQAQMFDKGQGGNFYENFLNRSFQGEEADTARRMGGWQQYVNSDLQNQQLNKQLGGSWMQDTLGRQFAGEEARLGRGTNAWEGERGRMVGAVGNALQGQGMDLGLNQALMGAGDINRSYKQDLLNQQYADWQDQQNHPYKMLDYMTGLLSRAQGGMSPNQITTQPGYAASPYAGLLGGALAAYGLSR